ncbi:unnamed protein product [Angiostrongylus costaricensis]|uniref:BACK domain-containing protein n=1 Tax=Angiostrongylus costaricensis TaxID=334426 RepID=A0A0R3PUD0_ANGCS|nr:unnamed protein product [Angiostrongylus costaricensis]
MGGSSSSPWMKSHSLADLDHLKPTAEQRAPTTRNSFSSFIRYLYTDQWDGGVDVLECFRDWFGCRQNLLTSLKKAKDNALQDGDLTIALTSAVALSDVSIKCMFLNNRTTSKEYCIVFLAHLPDYSIRCDSTIVSARTRAIVAGRSPHSSLHRAIQLIHIAKFFSLDKLVQLCEDVVVSSLCQESCVSILTWAADGGSDYVAHCAQSYLEAEFSHIATSHCLFDITLESLVKCVQSQFTQVCRELFNAELECFCVIAYGYRFQATEVEILEAVVRWGEHELLRRMEVTEREPNVVADTTHSISRRGVKRGDLCEAELRAILAPIASHLRIDYVLPPFHQSLNAAYCRGILERAPLRSDLLCPSTSEINPDIHWFRPEQDAPGPRYYVPYYKITKEHLRNMGERHEVGISHPPSTASCTFQVVISNLWPDLLCEENFHEIRSKILVAIESADRQYHVRLFPRVFHRRMAIHLIALRVLRTLEVDPECVHVYLVSDPQKEVTTPECEKCGDAFLFGRRDQHWPDIMTVKRTEVFTQPYEKGTWAILMI